ncbi:MULTISPECIES: helix-turn-helix domain-containing protein [Streptomycetaceae]|uniref:Putative DNA-binding protein n=1 Tax=Streptantibioticus cattleyicolor (strain ATCC 35852 / DSM 46488 / JCM 4925 / NBRC 14057 / NRRL 8057) TaxID=1003195 RepID=F8JPL0_STREN|nr:MULTISPECIES: helix-turn-helix transcriptional regulator [Streptomycetaceae]AEW97779.1 putative DNA-binding protein [Streptantibioticus cattleyicolor NRRL 8057 = DSM 46488]MYS62199.1 helix-turn-helix domain-containing protein [Streptomyces sp. SID5468]CCB78097.1 DNA-binding protein [Streptantibioticus cattleyicolor NRRL 8057 = DSM 46488]
MTTEHPGSGSMVRRILLGSQLRRLRESRGVTREEAGYSIRASESKISRMELGRVSFKERDVADLLTLYGVTEPGERDALLGLAREANVTGWWHSYGDVLPAWFQTYVGLEEAAREVDTFEVQFVHGLLQTEGYARAVVRLGQPTAADAEVDRRVDLRMRRQKILLGDASPQFCVVLDESALRRPFGGPEVMREQFRRLLEDSERPNVDLRVIPFEFGGHAAETGAFTLLRFPEPDVPDVVYLEQLTGALYLDKRDEVAQYAKVMDRLRTEALPPEKTRDLLRAMLEQC